MATPASVDKGLWYRQLPLGPMQNFIYLLGAPGGKEAAVVDPAWDPDAILAAVADEGRELTAIVLTHHHFDHTNAVPDILSQRQIPVYIQDVEVEYLQDKDALRSSLKTLRHEEKFSVAGVSIEVLRTPGHTPGSQCLHCAGHLFSGDTLFVDACGRCDLPGGDPEQMFHSLHHVLAPLPDETVVLPGHDYGPVPVSTMGRERSSNPYLTSKGLPGFVARRGAPRRG